MIYYKEVLAMYERTRVNTLATEYEQLLDIYEIDKYGNVYGKDGMEISKQKNSKGYAIVSLKVKNERRWKKCLVHRLVAYAFVKGRTEDRNEVDHMDGNKLNNKYNNLRWCTRKENMSNSNTVEKLWCQGGTKCYAYDFRLNYIGVYDSVNDARKNLGVCFNGVNVRTKQYYLLEDTNLERVLKINRKQKLRSIVITDIEIHKKYYFHSTTEARKFFDGKINITQAIQKNWTVRGKYKVRILNYKKLIGMLDL